MAQNNKQGRTEEILTMVNSYCSTFLHRMSGIAREAAPRRGAQCHQGGVPVPIMAKKNSKQGRTTEILTTGYSYAVSC